MANQSAVRGAHLASERVTVGQQPSIFDVLSQESLMSTLKPAFRHLVKYLASAYPGRFQKVHQFYDEVFAGFELLLQNYCLKNCGASFAENFYNMKRVVPATGKSPTDGWARVRSLIFLVAVPYLREKLDNLYDRLTLQAEVMGNQPPKTARDKLCKAFLAAYPWIKSALDFWTFALQFLYLISKSEVHSPFLKFAGVRLETLTPEDLARMGKQIEPLGPDAGMTLRIWRLLTGLPTVMFSGFSKVLGFGLFFLQFLDFWYSNEQTQKLNLGALPSPPAPQLMCREDQVHAMEPNKCPLCKNNRKNDTVLSVSGYVFCYSCIVRYVQAENKCPVTKIPAGPEHLIRIFSQVPKSS